VEAKAKAGDRFQAKGLFLNPFSFT